MSTKQPVSIKEAESVLKEEKTGHLGTFYGDFPYVLPLCYVYHKGNLYFHSGPGGQKLAGIRDNNRVCFQVDQVQKVLSSASPCDYYIDYRSVIVFGLAEEVNDYQEKADALKTLAAVFAGDELHEPMSQAQIDGVVVIKIVIKEATVKVSKSGRHSVMRALGTDPIARPRTS